MNLGPIRSAVRRRERATGGGDCCPASPPRAVVRYHQDGRDGEPVRDEGQGPPAPCRRGGRPARVLPLVVIYDPDFYGNAARLRGLTP